MNERITPAIGTGPTACWPPTCRGSTPVGRVRGPDVGEAALQRVVRQRGDPAGPKPTPCGGEGKVVKQDPQPGTKGSTPINIIVNASS